MEYKARVLVHGLSEDTIAALSVGARVEAHSLEQACGKVLDSVVEELRGQVLGSKTGKINEIVVEVGGRSYSLVVKEIEMIGVLTAGSVGR